MISQAKPNEVVQSHTTWQAVLQGLLEMKKINEVIDSAKVLFIKHSYLPIVSKNQQFYPLKRRIN